MANTDILNLPVATALDGTEWTPVVQGETTRRAQTQTIADLGGGGGGGGVTSVNVSGGTTGLTTSGGPIIDSGTITIDGTLNVGHGGTGIASGTSGGIPYFSSSSTIASSGALGANLLVLGGGAGAAPSALGSLGTATTVLHGNASGAPSFGAVSLTDDISGTLGLTNGGTAASLTASNGGMVYSGASSLAVLAGTATANQLLLSGSSGAPSWSTATYPATSAAGTLLTSATANAVTATATPTLGVAGAVKGTLSFAGNTSGTVVVQPAAAAGSWTLTLPTSGGTNGYYLQTDGSGVTSWAAGGGGGGGSPGGSNSQVQYNSAGSFAASVGFTFDGTSGITLGVAASSLGSIVLAGSTSGTTTLQPNVAASGTLTLPAATDTLVGRATTDTLTNKTLTSPTLTNPTLTAPVLGTPASGTLTNCTGLPLTTGITGTLSLGNGGVGITTAAAGTFLVAATANTISASATPTLGVAGATKGTLSLAGNTSGTVTIQPKAAAGTWSLTLPDTGGTNGYVLSTDGSGITSWIASATTVPAGSNTQVQYNAAGSFGASAGFVFDGTGQVTLGVATSALGKLALSGSTSGTTTIQPNATASGTLTLPAATDTLVGKATTDTLTNKTLTSPTLTTPVLGTPSSGTLTSCTGLPISTGVSGLGSNVATFLATPSSANLAAALTDETGSGANVFGTAPTFTTNITVPLVIGGTGTTSTLTYQTTTGVGATGADHIFVGGNNGATELARITNAGNFGIGAALPGLPLQVNRNGANTDAVWNSAYFVAVKTTNMADGFGVGIRFRIQDDANIGNTIGEISSIRDGADNSGSIKITPFNAGSQVAGLTLKSSGNVGIGAASPSNKLSVEGIAAPETDNAYTLGTSAKRWTTVYATTGAINTSDAREKTDIEPASLGLDFISALRPVSYRWRDGGTDVTFAEETYEIDDPVTEAVEVETKTIEVVDGKPIQRTTTRTEQRPVYDQVAVVDDTGKPALDADGKPLMHPVQRTKRVTLTRRGEKIETKRPGTRHHFGFIAQEVKAALDASGCNDFAGWVLSDKSDPDSLQSLRYDQFIAPLIKAVQELKSDFDAYKATHP